MYIIFPFIPSYYKVRCCMDNLELWLRFCLNIDGKINVFFVSIIYKFYSIIIRYCLSVTKWAKKQVKITYFGAQTSLLNFLFIGLFIYQQNNAYDLTSFLHSNNTYWTYKSTHKAIVDCDVFISSLFMLI